MAVVSSLRRPHAVTLAGLICAQLIVLTPPLLTLTPPLFDAPNHFARITLLIEGGDTYYHPAWSLLPNLAEDLIVRILAHIMPPMRGAQLFLICTIAMQGVAPLLLHRAVTGLWRPWPLSGFLFVYNRSLLWGFLNYSFGIGLALLGAALWVAMMRHSAILRIIIGASVAILCYFSHIEAFAVFALLALGFEVALADRRRSLVSSLAVLVISFLPVAVLFLVRWHPQTAPSHWSFSGLLRKPDLLFSVLDAYSRPFDVACFAALIVLTITGFWRRMIVVDRRFLPALGLILTAYIAAPAQLFGGSGVDHRLPPILFLLFSAAWRPAAMSQRILNIVALGLAALLIVRTGIVAAVWHAADGRYRQDLAIIDRIPEGAMVAVAYPGDSIRSTAIPEIHVPTLAASRRHAFVPTLFTIPGQQPITTSDGLAVLAAASEPTNIWAALHRPNDSLLARYDYVLAVSRKSFTSPPISGLSPVAGTPTFQLLKITASRR